MQPMSENQPPIKPIIAICEIDAYEKNGEKFFIHPIKKTEQKLSPSIFLGGNFEKFIKCHG